MKEEPEEQPLPQILTVSTKREPQDDEDWEPAARGSRKSAERKLSGAGPSGASVPERNGNLRCHLRVHQAENLRRLYVEEHMRKQSQ
uniref:Uncharacterized protein n=1 Tax=Knipowitschia caucasica TaxID=637954 RepID=A0AAV2KSM1_KNICA